MITGSQCRAGRALVEVSRAKLARRAGVDEATIEQFEHNLQRPASGEIKSIQDALEELGAVFLPENGGGIGVRLKFNSSEAKQIARLEGEGGPVASDRVP
jgi:transcriptional regulator with XRE-family HTH domain